MEKISVIIPIYNVEKYLDKCIESVVNQTYKNLEIILVDDGSVDNCRVICDRWEKRDNRIVVIHKENGGLSDARNVGIKAATGMYIGFVDSDDYITEDMYFELYNSLKENKSDLSVCGTFEENKKGVFKESRYDVNRCFSSEDALKELFTNCIIHHTAWNKLYKKELFDKIEFPKGRVYEDLAIMYKVVQKCERISVVGKCCYYHVYRKDGISKNLDIESASDYFIACDEVINEFKGTEIELDVNKQMISIISGIWIKLFLKFRKESQGLRGRIRREIVEYRYLFFYVGWKKRIKILICMFL